MIKFKNNGLSKKEVTEFIGMIHEVKDPYSDAYITKQNLRYFIKDNVEILFSGLKQGDKIAFDEYGAAIVIGFSDKAPRKYLKLLITDISRISEYLMPLYWNIKEDIYCKLKLNNPIKDFLLQSGFDIVGGRGKEILLVHKYQELKEGDKA